jgi:heavy metal efflux system protein
VEVKVEDVTGMPVLEIDIDRAAIARRGLSLAAVQEAIAIAIGGRDAGFVFEGDRRFDIVVRFPTPSARTSTYSRAFRWHCLRPRRVPAVMMPLREFANFRFSDGPNQISRDNGKRRVVVTANVRGRDLGSLVEEAQAKVAEQAKLPPGYWLVWGGQFENMVSAQHRLFVVVPACFVLIFLLLLGSLGSARDALLVFSAVPLALTGGVFALWLGTSRFLSPRRSASSLWCGRSEWPGDADVHSPACRGRHAVREAIFNGTLTRSRPVIMTALAALQPS